MDKEFEKKNTALEEFRLKVTEMYSLFREIANLDHDVHDSLFEQLIYNPAKAWRKLGGAVERSQFFHALISSTTEWGNSPDLDLPDGLVAKHLNEVVLPTLKRELEKLRLKNSA